MAGSATSQRISVASSDCQGGLQTIVEQRQKIIVQSSDAISDEILMDRIETGADDSRVDVQTRELASQRCNFDQELRRLSSRSVNRLGDQNDERGIETAIQTIILHDDGRPHLASRGIAEGKVEQNDIAARYFHNFSAVG